MQAGAQQVHARRIQGLNSDSRKQGNQQTDQNQEEDGSFRRNSWFKNSEKGYKNLHPIQMSFYILEITSHFIISNSINSISNKDISPHL